MCACDDTVNNVDPIKLSMLASSHKQEMSKTLNDWQIMFGLIYRSPSGAKILPPSRERIAIIFSRIAEEFGEVAEVLLIDEVVDENVKLVMESEIADLGAWIFSLANNLQHVDMSASSVTLADVSWNLYPGKCHHCNKLPCLCVRGEFRLELAQQGAISPAHWDDRTGLANPEAMKIYINSADRKLKGTYTPWSMIMFDLDNFGKVNKDFNNQIGDLVLKSTVDCMKSVLTEKAVAFRRGGEEFVIVLEGDMRDASVLAERVRVAIAREPVMFNYEGRSVFLPVTASFGVACTIDERKPPLELENIVNERMKMAKEAGKNCVRPQLKGEWLEWINLPKGYD